MKTDLAEKLIREKLAELHGLLIKYGVIIEFEGDFIDEESYEQAVDALMVLYTRHLKKED